MEAQAAKLLKVILDKCRGASVSEVRFVSGMSPAFVDGDGPHFVEVPEVSRELVSELHELCRSLADREAKSESSSIYTFTLRQLGEIRCEYQRRGNVARLVLKLDPEAAETVDAVRPKKPPSLRAEAMPSRKRKGH